MLPNNFHLFGKPTRDMIEIVKVILVQQHIYNSVPIFSLLSLYVISLLTIKTTKKSP